MCSASPLPRRFFKTMTSLCLIIITVESHLSERVGTEGFGMSEVIKYQLLQWTITFKECTNYDAA